MNKTFRGTVTGVAIGLLLGAVIPAQAADRAGSSEMKTQLALLTRRVRMLEATTGPAATKVVDGRLAKLESVTQLLDQDGSYYGFVHSTQVWSHYCESGDAAVWTDQAGYSEIGCSGDAGAITARSLKTGSALQDR